ncbi:hypothetical protein EDD18DRAFT_1143108 [Armillaria luteobubalina]|uniref:MYND-type domain-containing protein n=1 Tax=Armillaria luteobubalina TaxID=153913 RepID=A0AA39QEN6_9AGAR|nr:hypothetical protein EDD18DRAFT_1143108 [Armillaria luteobubalina]
MSPNWSSLLCIAFVTLLVVYLSAKFLFRPVVSEIEQIIMTPNQSNESESENKTKGRKEKLPRAEGDCETCWGDEYGEGEVILRRCAQCKNQFYCSEGCQRKDWKTHKYNCSPLYDDTTPATIPRDQESEDEIQHMGKILADWMKAFEAQGEAVETRQWKGSTLPEAAAFLEVAPSPHFPPYKREIPKPRTKKYRLPLVLMARLFLNDLVGKLSPEAKETLAGYISVINMPSGHAKLYGPKIMGRPADLSSGEYVSFVASAPIITMQEYGTCSFSKECQERWRNLATAKLFLWDD